MNNIKNLLLIGGDMRQVYMAKYLNDKGFSARIYNFDLLDGWDELKAKDEDLHRIVCENGQAVILPLPVSRDGKTVNSQYGSMPITPELLFSSLNQDSAVFAGMMMNTWKSDFFRRGIKVYDYFEREELAIKNAVPTAQGIIKIAIDNMVVTLHGSRCLVIGYGKTAKAAARALSGLGAVVTIAARKRSDIASAEMEGYGTVYISELETRANIFDLLVNTVPAQIINEAVLNSLNKDCLIIDIASAPYGVDIKAAEGSGFKVIVPGSLPGKTAPKTAGIIIADVILSILKEGSR
ncbi:MAG: dipicolinate synthase subunit DpsA [Clostridiales bacterium]|nr:dipicolinate synthase subunit DpsA [Clostridiales bacterium]